MKDIVVNKSNPSETIGELLVNAVRTSFFPLPETVIKLCRSSTKSSPHREHAQCRPLKSKQTELLWTISAFADEARGKCIAAQRALYWTSGKYSWPSIFIYNCSIKGYYSPSSMLSTGKTIVNETAYNAVFLLDDEARN